jgi:YVTN family beta-propeller protein
MAVTETSEPYLLVANPESGSVTALDVDTRMLVAVVQVGQASGEILLTPDRQYALTIDEQSGDLAVIRLSTFNEAWVHRYKSAPLFTTVQVGDRPAGAVVVAFRG